MSTRLLVIGIDSLDRDLFARERVAGRLPHMGGLAAAGPEIRLRSVFPPDSDTAWSTIYTGWNPARHGVVRFLDPLDKVHSIQTKEADRDKIAGKTFWDVAGRAGQRVGVVLPHVGYPAWQVNGAMISRSAVAPAVDVSALPGIDVGKTSDLSGVHGLPGTSDDDVATYLARVQEFGAATTETAVSLLTKHDWDVFFVYYSSLDAICHFFWSRCDPTDPFYPGPNRFEQVIANAYAEHDTYVGQLLATVAPSTSVLLLSDHGHGPRPVQLVHINEVLREAGLLVPASGARGLAAPVVEVGKRAATQLVTRLNAGRIAAHALKAVPTARQLYTRPITIDWERTVACASDLSGIKSYSYGGVRVAGSAGDYESRRDEVIGLLNELRHPDDGGPLVEFASRREDVYQGPYIDAYPNVILQLRGGFGVGWAIKQGLFGRSTSQSLMPGSHKGDSAVLLGRWPGRERPVRQQATLEDIAPTIYHLMGVTSEAPLDGASLIADAATQGAGRAANAPVQGFPQSMAGE